MKIKTNPIWVDLSDSPEEFEKAINHAVSDNERFFFENLRSKFLSEPAASNDILMHELNNEDGLYIIRVGTDDILIGKRLTDPNEQSVPQEFAGLFLALQQDLYEYLGRHLTLHQWLRDRDFEGVVYS